MVERLVWDQEVAGSNPVTPTTRNTAPLKPLLLNCALIWTAGGILLAQEPTLPAAETQDPAPEYRASSGPGAQSPSPTPAPPFIPPDFLPLPDGVASPPPAVPPEVGVQQLDDALKRAPVNAAAESSRKQMQWRELRNRIANDAGLRNMLTEADAARTDLQKRKLLRRYYEAYYARLGALVSTAEMKAYLLERKNRQIGALQQPRVRPEPPPKPKH